MNVYALILSAGFSSRMQPHFKPLLPLPLPGGPLSALAALCALYRAEGVHPVVVGGNRAEETKKVAQACDAAFALNPHPERGMFSSIRAGAAALPADCTHFFVHPVDIPLVRRISVRTLLEEAEHFPAAPLIPTWRGQSGHPPLFPAGLLPAIRDAGGEGCLRDVVEASSPRAVPVADSFILRDMDCPEDYTALCALAPSQDILSPEEAKELLGVRHVLDKGREHSLAVGAVAEAFALALNRARALRDDAPLSPELALAGGIVHDVCKGQEHHEQAAGRLFRSLGMERMARLVEDHRDLTLPDDMPLSERELVFLADKYVRGASPVPLRERFRSKMERFSGDAEACAAIAGRMGRALLMEARLEKECGQSPELLAAEALAGHGA
ncbi:DVU_1551 family NTP transferase [Mailhella massiliensis]|uniref:NTP transferase domain-containing protein n=1 Tax=Mailhella massiliensis TaxID=1903261 RepID=A0A921DQL6_9BACT|nr:NTP transferase domain-containing protein [Mailhella massiliensis]HJD96604.1 NTP transferase domain-containing protein [Mailhella massiliensis]